MAQPVPKSSAVKRPLSPRSWSPTSPTDLTVLIEVGGRLSLAVNPLQTDTVLNIKTLIERRTNIPVAQQSLHLSSGSQELEDSWALFDVGFRVEGLGMLYVNVHFTIYVDKLGTEDEVLTLDVKDWDTVHNIKTKIEDMKNIPVGQQILMFDGEELKDGRTLASYNIQQDNFVYLKDMVIHVSTLAGEVNLVLKVSTSDTINHVKAMIRNKRGTPSEQQRLLFGLQQLEDGMTLSYYNIQNHDVVTMIKVVQMMKVDCIKVSTGESYEPEATALDTIENLKAMIRAKEGWSLNDVVTLRKVIGNGTVDVNDSDVLGDLEPDPDQLMIFSMISQGSEFSWADQVQLLCDSSSSKKTKCS